MKLDPLNPKMAFLFGFGAPRSRRCRRHLQIAKFTGESGGPVQAVQPVGWSQKCKNTI